MCQSSCRPVSVGNPGRAGLSPLSRHTNSRFVRQVFVRLPLRFCVIVAIFCRRGVFRGVPGMIRPDDRSGEELEQLQEWAPGSSPVVGKRKRRSRRREEVDPGTGLTCRPRWERGLCRIPAVGARGFHRRGGLPQPSCDGSHSTPGTREKTRGNAQKVAAWSTVRECAVAQRPLAPGPAAVCLQASRPAREAGAADEKGRGLPSVRRLPFSS
jgi:hypothetical protein